MSCSGLGWSGGQLLGPNSGIPHARATLWLVPPTTISHSLQLPQGDLELCPFFQEEAGRVDEDINNDYLVISNNTITQKKNTGFEGAILSASEKPLCQMSLHPQLQCPGLIHILDQTAKKLQCYKGALITHHSNNFQLCTDTLNHSPTKQHVKRSFSAQVWCWMGGTSHSINIEATSN